MQEYDLKDFKSYLLFERGLSENTVQGYIRDIRAFYEYIDYDIKKFDLYKKKNRFFKAVQ